MPRSPQRQDAVDHTTPRWHPKHHTKEHAERTGPFWQGRVVKVVRASPDVNENQRPKVDDAEFVTTIFVTTAVVAAGTVYRVVLDVAAAVLARAFDVVAINYYLL